VRELVEAAQDDLDVAEKLFALGKHRYVCFFAQQAVEKFLKAYLLHKMDKYVFTHSIARLIKEAMKIDRDFEHLLTIRADLLEDYYTGTRYLPMVSVDEDDAREALDIAKRVRDFVLRKLESDP